LIYETPLCTKATNKTIVHYLKGEGAIRVAVITELLRSFYGASWYIGARLQLDGVETELHVLGV